MPYLMLLPEELLKINEMGSRDTPHLEEHFIFLLLISSSTNKLMSTCATNLMDPIEKNLPSSHAHGTIAYISER